jgi:predicted alpha/beta hydrolase family esterase
MGEDPCCQSEVSRFWDSETVDIMEAGHLSDRGYFMILSLTTEGTDDFREAAKDGAVTS